jgi:hypothetical protein
MRTRANIAAIALTAAVLLPRPALAVGWSGGVGLGYRQLDDRPAGSAAYRSPRFDLNLNLGAWGSILDPSIFNWSGDASYLLGREQVNGVASQTTDLLQYKLQANALHGPQSPIALNFFAARSDNHAQTGPDRDAVVNSVNTGYGAGFSFHAPQTPSLAAQYTWNDQRTDVPGQPEAMHKSQNLSIGTSQYTGPLNFTAGYNLVMSNGTYAPDHFDESSAGMSAAGYLGDVGINVNDSWWQRTPRASGAGTYSTEANLFGANVTWTPQTGYQTLRYRNQQSSSASGPFVGEAYSNAAGYVGEFKLAPEHWWVRPNVDVTHSRVRRDTLVDDATSETVGAQAVWRRAQETSSDEIRGGPTFGFLQTAATSAAPATSDIAWGVGGAAQTSRNWGKNQVSLSYGASYGSNIPERGSSLQQTANGTLSRPLGLASASASVLATTSRQSSPVLGTAATRNLTAIGNLVFPRYSFTGSLGIASSNSAAVPPKSFAGDGLLVPLPFDQQSVAARLGASFSFTANLSGSADAGEQVARAPGVPSLDVADLGLSLSYSVGGFGISVSDRLTFYGPARDHLQNFFFVNASRSFGGGR